MTDISPSLSPEGRLETKIMANKASLPKRLKKRHKAEFRFRMIGLGAIVLALSFLGLLMVNIVSKGHTAFWQSEIKLTVYLDQAIINPSAITDESVLMTADFGAIIKKSLRDRFPEVAGRKERLDLYKLVSNEATFQLRDLVLEDPSLIGQTITIWVLASDDVDMLEKGFISRDGNEADRQVNDMALGWIDSLDAAGDTQSVFNIGFFTKADSREPEIAGIMGAVMGSFWLLLVTFVLSFPLGVATAIYLEEFSPRNRLTDFIEVNINNLAAVPSIVFGLLGLAIFLGFFEMSRSAPLVGGLVLSLMTLPTIIIASRVSLKSVPPSIREAALGMGASRLQMVFHHVLPLAMPGVLTGAIIGMARALGETAPLIMIGMVAFIMDVPDGIFDKATALPVQVYIWADSPERAFVEKTSAAIMVLLAFLISMNLTAILLRRKFSKKW